MTDFNPGDASHFQNETILPLFEAMRAAGSLHYCEDSNYGPYWSVLNYPEIMAIDKNHEQFSSDAGLGGIIIDDAIFKDDEAGFFLQNFISMDPPQHGPQRKAVNQIISQPSLANFRDLITEGIIGGVGGVIIFLPQILILLFIIGIMENTGYLARVSFMMDRLMSGVGLNGKAFIPVLSSYACAIPGIMATRTMESARDRLITILVVPITSCSARLPVYLMLIALMLPNGTDSERAMVMLGLYVLSILGVYFFAWLFNRKLEKTETALTVLELPTYQRPSWREIGLQIYDRGKIFVKNAGTVILCLSIILWALTTYPKSESEDGSEQLAHSIAGRMGKVIEPVIEPLGYDWKMGIGLIASFAAREMFVVPCPSSILEKIRRGMKKRRKRERFARAWLLRRERTVGLHITFAPV